LNFSFYNISHQKFFNKRKHLNLWDTQLKERLFDGEVNYTYMNNLSNDKLNTGIINMRIFIPKEGKLWEDENPTFKMRIIENKTIDKWLFISKYIKIRNFWIYMMKLIESMKI
jgi:hypothetical protein